MIHFHPIPKPARWALVTVGTALVGLADYLTGHELGFFVFYFIPIGAAAWYLGTAPAAGVSIVSAALWVSADVFAGHLYSSYVIAAWNTLMRLTAFLIMAFAVSRIRGLILEERAMSDQLRTTLAQIKVLEGLLPICAACKKIRDKRGSWQQLEEYIEGHSGAQFTHSLCPGCGRKLLEEAGIKNGWPEPPTPVQGQPAGTPGGKP